MRDGRTILVLPGETEGLRKAGLLKEDPLLPGEETPEEETPQPEEETLEEETREPDQKRKTGYKLPVLTQGERRARIKQAKKLNRQGYSQREIARRLGVSHTAIQKWFKKKKSMWQPLATF